MNFNTSNLLSDDELHSVPLSGAMERNAGDNDDESARDKVCALKHILNHDIVACDAKWTLFVAAALSYRYVSELIPFPPQFVLNQGLGLEFNIDDLIDIINDTPRLRVMQQLLNESFEDEINPSVLDLLFWVLVVLAYPFLRPYPLDEFVDLMQRLDCRDYESLFPTHVFEVLYAQDSRSESEFDKVCNTFPTAYGFFGGPLDAFYNLLNNGFKQYRGAANNFIGDLLELAPTLRGSLKRSPSSAAWGSSTCGSIISCVALCEYIDNPHFVHIKARQNNQGSLHCEKIEIFNCDLVRLRYLIFYGNRVTDLENEQTKSKGSWYKRRAAYLSISLSLLAIGTAFATSTDRGRFIVNFCARNVHKAYDICRNSALLDFLKYIK